MTQIKRQNPKFSSFFLLKSVRVPFLHLKMSKIVQERTPAKKGRKNRDTHGFQKKKLRKFRILSFYLGHFSTKERNICLFLFVLSNFLCFKAEFFFSLLWATQKIYFDKNVTHLWEESVSYNWNPWETLFCTKGSFFCRGPFCTIFDIF